MATVRVHFARAGTPWWREGLCSITLLAAFGCSSTKWDSRIWTKLGPPPPHVVIRIYGEVTNDGVEDPLSALRQALVHSLADRGINAFVTISPVRPPPPPRVDVQIVGGDSGNDAVAYFVGVGSAQGWMVVDVRMHTPDGRGFAFRGRVEGWGEEVTDAATEIGRAIAEELASGGAEGP